ncbi:hypothetical protein [Oceanobacter kriegii]|uniref:hypothetical protein n=1 Tax=Oceanobacter kriegii TaxID=64972 RepID=UPI00048655DD|nr:hypothetical protein [Oceanobacter kriegii]
MKTTTITMMTHMTLAAALAMGASAATAGFSAQVEQENVTDDQGNRNTKFETQLRYRTGGLGVHFEYEYDPEAAPASDKKLLEFQQDYRWKTEEGYFNMFTNEMYHNYQSGQNSAELTWFFYTPANEHGVRFGFDLEVDYLSKDEWGLHEIEIEPTVKWAAAAGPGQLNLELEAPVTRLYSKTRNNMEFETVEFQAKYEIDVAESTYFWMEMVLPYDMESKSVESELNLTLGTKF